MVGEPELAFCVRDVEPPGVEVRVNFGVFAGRGATAAEIGAGVEASLNQVRIELGPDQLPDDERELDVLCGRLVEAADSWARSCIADRHAEVSEL